MDESKHQTGQAYLEERWATIGYQISGERVIKLSDL